MTPLLVSTAPQLGYNYGYNVAPTPQAGAGAFGKVPGTTGIPPSQWQQAIQSVPGLAGNAEAASSAIQSEIAGQLPAADVAQFQRNNAAFGVQSGQPNTPYSNNQLLESLDLGSLALTQSGLGAFNSLAGTVGGLQENPALMSEISQSNAMLNAAPDPQQAFQEMQNLYQRYAGAGPAGGTGTHILAPSLPGVSYPGNGPVGSPDNPWATGSQVLSGSATPGVADAINPPMSFNSWAQATEGSPRYWGATAPSPTGTDTNLGMGDPFGEWANYYLAGGGDPSQASNAYMYDTGTF